MKKLLTLFLIAVMCLSFVACGGENNTTTPQKIERGTVTTSDNHLLPILLHLINNGWNYELKEDGTCTNNAFWWIYRDENESLAIYIADEYKYKFDFIISADDTITCYEAHYDAENVLTWITPSRYPHHDTINFGLTSKYVNHPFVSEIFGTWTIKDSKPSNYNLYQNLTLNNDGTCVVDGVSAIWGIFDNRSYDQGLLFINFYKDGSILYSAEFYKYLDSDNITISPCYDDMSQSDSRVHLKKVS